MTTVITEYQYKAVLPNLVILTTYALVDGQWVTLIPFSKWSNYLHINTFASLVNEQN